MTTHRIGVQKIQWTETVQSIVVLTGYRLQSIHPTGVLLLIPTVENDCVIPLPVPYYLCVVTLQCIKALII